MRRIAALSIAALAILAIAAPIASAGTYQTKIYKDKGGDRMVVAAGGELIIQGTFSLSAPGSKFYVDATNGSATGDGTSWATALTTIDLAVNKCTASSGDRIFVAPWHAENLAADSAVDVDLAGVTIIGVRLGRQMPTLTATAAAGDLKLAAANCTVQGIRFLGGIDAVSGCIEVSAADCAVIDCEYRGVTGQATDILITTAAADRLLIDGFRVLGAAAGGANAAIALVGADDAIVRNVDIYGNFAVGAIDLRTTLSPRVQIYNANIWTENAADVGIVDTVTSSTGAIGPNVTIRLQDDANNLITAVTGATFHLLPGVFVVNADAEIAVPINWTPSAPE